MARPIFSTPTSLTDLAELANIERAAAELDRALDRDDAGALTDWARRYGPQAMAVLREVHALADQLNDGAEFDEAAE